jgi:hypothetical protein
LGPFTGALFTTRHTHAPENARAQVFTISAGLKVTTAAAGAAIGGSIAHLPVSTQLLFTGVSPVLAGAVRGPPLRWRLAETAIHAPGQPNAAMLRRQR